MADRDFLFQLANEEQVRQVSFSSQAIAWEEHCRWFVKTLDSNIPFYLGIYRSEPVGYVRFSPALGEPGCFTVSIALTAAHCGQGLGAKLLRQGYQELFLRGMASRCEAYIKKGNLPSCRIFEKCHFVQEWQNVHDRQGVLRYVYPGYDEAHPEGSV